MRRAAKIDENQPDIVKGLRKIGASVQPLHAVGAGCPDLLVGYQGQNYLIEIKNPEKPKYDRRLTPDQAEWHGGWEGQKAVCETIDECLVAIGRKAPSQDWDTITTSPGASE